MPNLPSYGKDDVMGPNLPSYGKDAVMGPNLPFYGKYPVMGPKLPSYGKDAVMPPLLRKRCQTSPLTEKMLASLPSYGKDAKPPLWRKRCCLGPKPPLLRKRCCHGPKPPLLRKRCCHTSPLTGKMPNLPSDGKYACHVCVLHMWVKFQPDLIYHWISRLFCRNYLRNNSRMPGVQ